MPASPLRRRGAPAIAAACALLAVLAAVPATAVPTSAGDVDVAGQSQPVYTQTLTESYEVPTPHGTIRGDVIRPVVPEGVQVPVILTYTPYSILYGSLDPLRTSRADDATADFFVRRGYARAVFDVVGTHGSDGCTDFGGTGERETAAAVVDFLGGQPWSNGRVGMIGASYDGTTALAAAVEAPEHLVTVVPQVAIDRWYDYMYDRGVRLTLEDEPFGLADPPADSPADYDALYGVVPPPAGVTGDPAATAALLADHLRPCNRAEHAIRGYQQDPVYDGFWVERDYRALADRVRASVLIEGAWLDDNVKHWASTRFFQALAERRDEEGRDAPAVHLVMWQWSHSTSRFPDAAQVRHAWFDHFLLGLDTGLEALPVVDTHGSDGVRRQHATWPPAGTEEVRLDLVAGAAAADQLGLTSPDATWTDRDPTAVEQVLLARGCAEDTCLRLLGAPLAAPVRLAGSPRLELELSTAAASTHLAPVLVEVLPSGTRRVITRGLLNSRNRDGLERSTPLVPGAPWRAEVELWDVDHTVGAGSRLELVLASTNATWGLSDETRAATALDLDASSVVLPVVGPGAAD
jgi:X-Pro dipeptidyl-peptidase